MKVAFLCSGCTQTIPSPEELFELPCWHPIGGCFMAHRCRNCFGRSLQETNDRIGNWNDETEAEFSAFLDTWEIASRFPQTRKPSLKETAEAVMRLVTESDGRVFVPLILANLKREHDDSGDDTVRVAADSVALLYASMADDEEEGANGTPAAGASGQSVALEDTSELFQAALRKAMNELRGDESDSQALIYKAVATVVMRIAAGEEGLHDPQNPADRTILDARPK
jgi:hypothetical protein